MMSPAPAGLKPSLLWVTTLNHDVLGKKHGFKKKSETIAGWPGLAED